MVGWLRTGGRLFFIVLCCNGLTALLLVAYISPQQMPFMQKQQAPRVIMASERPQTSRHVPEAALITGHPVRIRIPAADIDLPIADGTYDPAHRAWSLSANQAHYALITPAPNNHSGNTFIYGHNKPGVFANLMDMALGDRAYVQTSNGYTFAYTLSLVKDVSSGDMSVFQAVDRPVLTVQTCAGTWYEDRRLFEFSFVSVDKDAGR